MTDRPRRERFGRLRFHASDAEIARSLADLRALWAPDPRQRAERRFEAAKARMTAASEAVLRGEPDASEQADAALAEFTAAQAELRRLDAAQS